MEIINIMDNAATLIDKVNENFGFTVVADGSSAIEMVFSINAAFNGTDGAEILFDGDSANEFVRKLNDNFAKYGSEQPVTNTFRFLHISDPHGYYDAAQVCNVMMSNNNGIAFTFLTGDVSQYSTNMLTSNLAEQINAMGPKVLLLAGNHDTYDMSYGGNSASQQTTTNYIKHYLGNNVNWGDQSGVASYWYKDFSVGEHTLRIIAIDQYETGNVRNAGNYYTQYSQSQIDWFIDRITELTGDDFLIVAVHETPLQTMTIPDPYAVAMRPSEPIAEDTQKLFVTEAAAAYAGRQDEPNINLLPRIMEAYMSSEQLSLAFINKGGNTSSPDVTVNEDFSQITPATFLFWLCGHSHCDMIYYLPDETGETYGGDFSDQLMMVITAASRSVKYATRDDLGGTGNAVGTPANPSQFTYRINDVTLDFDNKTITIERIGDMNTYGGRTRNSVVFPFKRTIQ